MASNSPYPSPGDNDMNSSGGPFYTGELDLAAKLSRAAAPLMVSTTAEDQAHHALVTASHASHVLTPNHAIGSPQQLAQDVMSLQTEVYDPSPRQQRRDILIPESSHVRKRTKVSRACDECRRKKTKCSATPESTEACTGCTRSGITCLFSREPLKRGPSKGYIRHLSERLATLERTLGSHSVALTQATHTEEPLESNNSLTPLTQHAQNALQEYPTSQILYVRMERLEDRIEQVLSQLTQHSKPDVSSHQPQQQQQQQQDDNALSMAESLQMEMASSNQMSHEVSVSDINSTTAAMAALENDQVDENKLGLEILQG